jgi:hypothetical protein
MQQRRRDRKRTVVWVSAGIGFRDMIEFGDKYLRFSIVRQ